MTIELINKHARALVMVILVLGVVFMLFIVEAAYRFQTSDRNMVGVEATPTPFIGPIEPMTVPNGTQPVLQDTKSGQDLQPSIKGSSLDGQR